MIMDSEALSKGLVPITPEALSAAVRTARNAGLLYKLPKTAEEIMAEQDFHPEIIHTIFPPVKYPEFEVSIHTDIGNRKTQEDRFTFSPQLIPHRLDTAFFGVFDGTVGDFASETIKTLVIPHLLGSIPWRRIVHLLTCDARDISMSYTKNPQIGPNGSYIHSVDSMSLPNTGSHHKSSSPVLYLSEQDKLGSTRVSSIKEIEDQNSLQDATVPPILQQIEEELPALLWASVDWMYLNADTELIQRCEQEQKHYASSTSVTVILAGGYCCVGHLGDSRVALGYERDGRLYGEFLTSDHKPNMQQEHERIVRNGGSVEYLHNHNNKPFIRGGDFTARKTKGEQPMQLQYSRAFGGKDLKMFGLSNEPDVRIFKLDPRHHVLVLASDGIWDVQTAAKAVELALVAKGRGENPAAFLLQTTLEEQRLHNQNSDNVTVIVVFLEEGKRTASFQAMRNH